MALQGVSLAGSLLVILCVQCSIRLIDGQPATGDKCSPVAGSPSCVCDHSTFGRIDLTGFGNSGGTPKYTGLTDPNGYIYSFNPCYPYSVAGGCDNVFSCQADASGNFNGIADADEAIYTESDGKTVYLYYTGPQSRYVRVYLQCDAAADTPLVTTIGDSGPVILHYVFNMTSSHFCFSSGAGGGDIAGVVGLVLIFLFLGSIVAYFAVGAIIMKFKFQASGTDIVPNKAFWLTFPLLIRDGFIFTFGPCETLFNERVRGYSKT